jgi:SAM-dependent methyltransferase
MHEVRPLSDKEYAECFNVFKKISTEWEAIEEWLRDEFLPHVQNTERTDVLSVGSGTGEFDLALMKLMRSKVSHIVYRAIDPNSEHNRIFQRQYEDSEVHVDSLEIIPKPFGLEKIDGAFDLIHMTHCLYYIPDRKAAIRHAYELLKPDGSLLIFHQTALGINEVQRAFMRRVKGDEKEMFSSYDVLKLLEALGIPCQYHLVISDLDVTDCVEGNATGKQLLCFFLESHIESLEATLHEEIVAFLKENCRLVNGRYLLFHPGGIFWVRKIQ